MTNFLKNRWVQGLVAVAVLGAVVLVLQGEDETTVENVEVTTTEVETTEETTTDVTE